MWSFCLLKSHRSLCVSFSRTGAGLCIYHLLVRSNLNFVHISQWITLPTQSCLALYSFCANLLHSLIMWLYVSSLSPHSLHLLFCCVLSILASIWSVLMALSCAAIRIDFVSLLRFPFINQVQVFWCGYYNYLWGFHISIDWLFFSGIWVTASLLRFSGLPNILTDLNIAVAWIFSILPWISRSFRHFSRLFWVILKVPSIVSLPPSCSRIYLFSLTRSRYSLSYSLSISFTLWSSGTAILMNEPVFLFNSHKVRSSGWSLFFFF